VGEPGFLGVHLYRGLQRGASVRVDLTVQRNLFELWCGPFHGFYPFRKQESLRIMERHFAYQTLGAVSRWIKSCGGKRVSQCREWRSDLSTWLTVGDQAVLVGTQRRERNAREPHDERIGKEGVQNGGIRSRYRLDRWERRLTKSEPTRLLDVSSSFLRYSPRISRRRMNVRRLPGPAPITGS
jgi:hypothetical protein